jgi:hypothetical protein
MKTCSKCEEEKELDGFSKDKYQKDGLYKRCKSCVKIQDKERYIKIAEKSRKQATIYNTNHKEERAVYQKEYNEKNSKIMKVKRREYKQQNSERLKIYKNNYEKNRRKTDPLYSFASRTRNNISSAFIRRSVKKNSTTHKILGCSFEDFQIYLEKNLYEFKISDKDIQIDHIVPISQAETEDEVVLLNHYTNFQLLPSVYNNIKSDNKWDQEDFENWLGDNWSWGG